MGDMYTVREWSECYVDDVQSQQPFLTMLHVRLSIALRFHDFNICAFMWI